MPIPPVMIVIGVIVLLIGLIVAYLKFNAEAKASAAADVAKAAAKQETKIEKYEIKHCKKLAERSCCDPVRFLLIRWGWKNCKTKCMNKAYLQCQEQADS